MYWMDKRCVFTKFKIHRFPDPLYTRIAARTIRQQAYDLPVSDWPCGANCIYDLTFPALVLRCEDGTANIGLEETVLTRYGHETSVEGVYKAWNPERIQYMAAPYVLNEQFMFDISFHGLGEDNLQNISCTILSATYIAHVKYQNWIQSVTPDVSGVAKDLSNLKVRFGVVTNSDGRHAAVETVDETEILLKGA